MQIMIFEPEVDRCVPLLRPSPFQAVTAAADRHEATHVGL